MNVKRTQGRPRRGGFSLAELMVVIVIIGLLATLVVPNVVQKLFQSQGAKAKADIVAIAQAITDYTVANNGRSPDSLEVLVTEDENGFKYLDRDTVPKDPWGNEYLLEPASTPGGTDWRVYTLGADGLQGGEGKDRDIDNIMIKNQEI